MNFKRILQIARWEYFQKVRAKSFIISIFLTPAFIGMGIVVPGLLINESGEETVMIGLVDSSGTLHAPLKAYLDANEKLDNGQPAYVLGNYTAGGVSRANAIKRADSAILDGTLEGAFIADDSAGSIKGMYRSENPGNFRVSNALEQAVERVIRKQRLSDAGIDTALYSRMSPNVEVATVKVSEDGEDGSVGFGETFFTSYLLSMMLMLLVMTSGGSLVRSLVEEKSNRIMEILVSSAEPQELMWGKLLGLSGLGLTQVLAWVVLGLIAALGFASSGVLSHMDAVLSLLPLLLVYLLLGYVFYSAIFVGFGSLVTTEQEAQVMTSYLVLLMLIPTIIAIGVIANPDASWIRVLSYIPMFTPQLMMLRIVTKMPPPGEIIGTLALMVASTVLLTWACSKIFRTAILLYGKRPSMREVLRWLREA
ncbi:MAG: ABC transporter permease [bacterium]|nr:ABC transporter permease [Candidatus Kapabacteria bacterium]